LNLLRQMEQTVLAEGREWMRRRLEKQLQAASDALEAICPQTGQGLTRLSLLRPENRKFQGFIA
jgi:hypothetical protein